MWHFEYQHITNNNPTSTYDTNDPRCGQTTAVYHINVFGEDGNEVTTFGVSFPYVHERKELPFVDFTNVRICSTPQPSLSDHTLFRCMQAAGEDCERIGVHLEVALTLRQVIKRRYWTSTYLDNGSSWNDVSVGDVVSVLRPTGCWRTRILKVAHSNINLDTSFLPRNVPSIIYR